MIRRPPAIFAEILKVITLEVMFHGFGGGDLNMRREMWNRLCRRTGAPEKQVAVIKRAKAED